MPITPVSKRTRLQASSRQQKLDLSSERMADGGIVARVYKRQKLRHTSAHSQDLRQREGRSAPTSDCRRPSEIGLPSCRRLC